MNQYPDINAGDGFGSVSARQWRQLMEEHKALQRAVFGTSNVQRTASGIRENARTLPSPSVIPDKTVVIVRKPVEGDLDLRVREAKYVNLPPKPCTGDGESATCFYEWYGLDFDAYPPLGTKAVEFAGDENTADVSIPPKLTTKFHRIHREHDVWVVERAAAGGGVAYCVVREVFGGGSIIVHVQLIGEQVINGTAQWVVKGGVVEALAKPGRLSSHYAAWVWQGAIHQTQTRFLPLYYTGGKPRLGFELICTAVSPASARVTDCRPFTRATEFNMGACCDIRGCSDTTDAVRCSGGGAYHAECNCLDANLCNLVPCCSRRIIIRANG